MLLVAAFALSEVFLVQDAASLQSALTNSRPGDSILLSPGHYFTDVVIDGKGVELAGTGGPVWLQGRLEIRNLPAGQTVSIRNLEKLEANVPAGLLVADNEGLVLFQDFDFTGGPWFPSSLVGRLEVQNSSAVVFDSCVLSGDDGNQVGPTSQQGNGPSPALELADSSVWLYDCMVEGGSSNQPWLSFDGAPAVTTSGDSQLAVIRSSLKAGKQSVIGCLPMNGAPALEVVDGTLVIARDAAIFEGGPIICSGGIPGPEISDTGGTSTQLDLSGPGARLDAPDQIGTSTTWNAAIQTDAGALTLLLIAADSGANPQLTQPLFPARPLIALVPLGAADANGTITASFVSPALVGLNSFRFLVQAGLLDPATLEIGLSNPLSLLVF
jgi:hypothetical protein